MNEPYHYFEDGQKILRIPTERASVVGVVRSHSDYQFELAANLGKEPILCKCRTCVGFRKRLIKNKRIANVRPR